MEESIQDVPAIEQPTPFATGAPTADLAGRYTIRKAPRDNALSTVEAAYHALTILDKEPKGLIEAFDKMIEFQLKQVPEHLREQHFGERNR
ncbi:hypothetical protein JCM19232_3162 [Vibrio ishigakensis]|uniref:tRNA-uridine aminocarboxypropyltransferase n=1 Tax=Vibrio ishigakensis TaxID=1481914 RepID=A0A0B8PQC3_9VIBR|nr:hypothetical protein JCM19232_3162 [Vibrio ishigakensis]